MADRYWVGGTGTWNTTSTTNWSATSGGSGGASVPTVADSVFFDQATTYTVTMTGALACLDITVSAGTVTFAQSASPSLNVRGSMSLVAGTVWGVTGPLTFSSTTTGRTITTNGTTISGSVTFNGAGGAWTLGSAFTTVGAELIIRAGTLSTSTSNYALTCSTLATTSSGSVTLTLNGSTLTITGSGTAMNLGASGNFIAGTSTINFTSTQGLTLSANNITFYDVQFSGAITTNQTITIIGTLGYRNLTFTSPVAEAILGVVISSTQSVSGTFSGSGSQANRRIFYRSSTYGTGRTISCTNAATISNADFRDINAGTNPITATTGGGNCGGNSNITFPAAKTVYWNLAGAQNWSAIGWATTSGGTPAVANFPLAQDTAVFDNTGSVTGTITLDAPWNLGSLDMSGRTNAMELSISVGTNVHGSWSRGTGVLLSGAGTLTFAGRNVVQTVSGVTPFTGNIIMDGLGGTFNLGSDIVFISNRSFTLTRGTLALNSYTLTAGSFASNNSIIRAIQFGTGNITVNGAGGTLWNTLTTTNLTISGTPVVNVANTTSSTTTIQPGGLAEGNSISFNFTTGTYILNLNTSNVRSLDFTGFSGTLDNAPRTIYGDMTLSPTMVLTAGTNTQTFASTSATPRNITTNGELLDFPVTFNGTTGSWVLQDAMTVGSTRTTTLFAGTLNLNGKTLTTGLFNSSGSSTRSIAFGTGNITVNGAGGTLWTTATTAGLTTNGTQVVNVSYSGSAATTITPGALSEANSISFNFTAGTYALTLSGTSFRDLNFTGFSGTLNNNAARTIYGSLTISSTMTMGSGSEGASALTFAATSGTKTITINGKIFGFPVIFNGVGGTWQLQDAMTIGSISQVTFTNGTVNLNGKTLTTRAAGTATGTKNLTFNGGALVLSASSSSVYAVAFSNAAPTGFTTTAGTGIGSISLTSATAKTFDGGGSTFNCTINQGGAGALTITGSNTFGNITNTVQPASVLFTAGTTTTFTSDFSLSGTAGNLVTISSVTAAQHTLSKASGIVDVSYCNISYSNATGGATWNAFT